MAILTGQKLPGEFVLYYAKVVLLSKQRKLQWHVIHLSSAFKHRVLLVFDLNFMKKTINAGQQCLTSEALS